MSEINAKVLWLCNNFEWPDLALYELMIMKRCGNNEFLHFLHYNGPERGMQRMWPSRRPADGVTRKPTVYANTNSSAIIIAKYPELYPVFTKSARNVTK